MSKTNRKPESPHDYWNTPEIAEDRTSNLYENCGNFSGIYNNTEKQVVVISPEPSEKNYES